jgi:hypothetical protein
VYDAAAGRGDIDMCAYLHSQHCPWSDFTSVAAAVNGYSDTRWLHEHGCEWHADLIHLAAAWSGSIDTMLCLQQQGLACADSRNADGHAEYCWSREQAGSSTVAETARS